MDDNQPNLFAAPTPLDFTTPESRDFLTLSPQLRQPFFIGDGQTSFGQIQSFIAPAGATRLFLGTEDGHGWFNNTGSFQVTLVPEPAALGLLTIGGLVLLQRRK